MYSKILSVLGELSGAEQPSSTVLHGLTVVIAISMAILHLAQTAYFILPSDQMKNTHVGLSLILTFLILADIAGNRRTKLFFAALALIALVPMGYIHLEYGGLITERVFGPNRADVFIATLLVALAFLAAYFQWGLLFTAMSLLALLYGYFGYLMPGELLFHAGVSFARLMSYASIPAFQGLLGSLTDLSASLIFMFMLFIGLLKSTGGMDLVMILGRKVAGRTRAGPAHLAVVSSGLMGMISGSTVANVASTGALSIRLMKRFGYTGAQAGAIEAVASTGGQFAPPIMGLTAFLIVGMTGFPYVEIMAAAVLPALIYYLYLMVAAHIFAVSRNIGSVAPVADDAGMNDLDLPMRAALKRYGHLLIAVAVLVYFLVVQLPPAHSAFIAICVIIATETIKQLWSHRAAPLKGLREAVMVIGRGFDAGARDGAQLAIVITVIGILVDILVVTGFAQKLSFSILSIAQGQLWLLLLLSAGACIVFGLGMPTPAAYILVALLGVPALLKFGIPVLSAHMFVFFFANMSAITPPIAVAALVAAKIAEADYIRTSFVALRLGLPGFILPFLFIYKPEILLLSGGPLQQALIFVTALAGVILVNVAFEGFMRRRLSIPERIAVLIGAVALIWPSNVVSMVGLAFLAAGLARQVLPARQSVSTSSEVRQ